MQYAELDDVTIISYDLDAIDGGVHLKPDVRLKDRNYHWLFNKFWYENGWRQGEYGGDRKNITDARYGKERGREINLILEYGNTITIVAHQK